MNKINQALFEAEMGKFFRKDPAALETLETKLADLFRQYYYRLNVPEIQRRVRSLGELPCPPQPDSHYLINFGIRGVMRYPLPTGETIFKIPVFSFPMNPWKDHWTATYLIVGDNGLTLVDTGTHLSEASMREGLEVVREIYGVPAKLEDIETVIITHAHYDHFGGLTYLLPASGGKLLVHEWDAKTIANYPTEVEQGRKRIARFLKQAGMPEDESSQFMKMHGDPKRAFPGYPVTATFSDGDRVVNDFEVVHTPGHCPGLSCIRVADVMLLGDQVLNDVSPHQFPKIYTEASGLLNYLNSLVKISAHSENIRLGLPSHYGDIHDIEARAMEIMSEHNQRVTDLMKDLVRPKSLYEITTDYYQYRRGRELTGYERLLALEEIGAHVEYMIETLEIVRPINGAALNGDSEEIVLYEKKT